MRRAHATQEEAFGPEMGLTCRLFGHTGNGTESGYHVCSRCGMHEYHSHPEYQKAAVLFRPWWRLKRKVHNAAVSVMDRWRRWKRRKEIDDCPF